MARPGPALLLVLSLSLLAPWTAWAAGVRVLFDVSSPGAAPFPSDLFTVSDPSHLTGRRVNLPKPDCVVRPSDCADLDVINTLDGFNLQPRLSIPFSGAIDVASVSSRSVFLVRLGSAGHPSHREPGRSRDSEDRDEDESGHGGGREHGRSRDSEDRDEDESGDVVGINQVVWDPATNTLHAESDELLDQHTRYALIVTDGVRDGDGNRVEAGDFDRFRRHLSSGQARDPDLKAYRKELLDVLARVDRRRARVVAASVFTTQSATAVLERIRAQIKADTLPPATILASFPLSSITAIQFRRQTGTSSFTTSNLPTPALALSSGVVGTVAFGRYASPDYETAQKFIPAVGTRTGTPAVQAVNDIYFNLFLPAASCRKPTAGWPVAIFGHGFTDSKQGAPFAVAATMAGQCLATIAINVVGHGGGSLGTLTVIPTLGTPVTIPAGGRGIDQDGNGTIDSTEGVNAAFPRTIISNRDGLRQTVVDLTQLVRVIETGGVDVDGDRVPDLDGSRIYFFGQSFGGIYGTIFLGVEPSVRVGVPNVPGGPIIDIARISPVFRVLVGIGLAGRGPSLLNAGTSPFVPPLFGFNENLPLRDQDPLINTVPGAMAIQEVIDNTEWVSQSGNPVAYAPHLRKDPLDGVPSKKVIFQFAKGDQTVPNPTTTNILRAGDLGRRATYFRNDLVFADPTRPGVPRNPHTFLTNIGVPAVTDLAIDAQSQIAVFFASDGRLRTDPDGAGPFFEVPIEDDLPETLSFLP
jgi:hypothetical protein